VDQRFTSTRPIADLPQVLAMFAARRGDLPEGKRGGWYSITNLSQSEAEVYIYDEIGFWGVTASEFMNDLAGITASKITLRINSPGGDVFDGIAIFNAVKRHPAECNVYVDGLAASAASFIAMAGDSVTMSPHSQMMIHEAAGLVIGPADDMRKMADILDKSSDNIASIYAEKAGGTTEEWRAKMRDETWFSDSEAVEAGLADRIDGEDEEAIAARMASRAAIVNTEEIIPEAADEIEVTPEPVDFGRLLEEIVEDTEDALFAVA